MLEKRHFYKKIDGRVRVVCVLKVAGFLNSWDLVEFLRLCFALGSLE